MAFIRAEDKELKQMQHQLDGCGQPHYYRLLLATFLDLRFVIKFNIFTYNRENLLEVRG